MDPVSLCGEMVPLNIRQWVTYKQILVTLPHGNLMCIPSSILCQHGIECLPHPVLLHDWRWNHCEFPADCWVFFRSFLTHAVAECSPENGMHCVLDLLQSVYMCAFRPNTSDFSMRTLLYAMLSGWDKQWVVNRCWRHIYWAMRRTINHNNTQLSY